MLQASRGSASRAFAAAFVGIISSVANVHADPVLTFNATTFSNNVNQSLGWQFDVLAPIPVTGLGWFDDSADGLSHAHQVGIWSPTGSLLKSAVVPAGTAAPLDGQFRTVSVSPITLTPGNGYIVGGENFADSTDRIASNVQQFVIPQLRYIDATFGSIGFVRPFSFSAANTGFYGPSFSTVPEPTAFGGVLAAAIFLRRRRHDHR